MIKATKQEHKEFERPQAGTYNAVCQSVHDVGVQLIKGQHGDKQTHQIVICWEIDETMKTGEYAGKRFVVSNTYTLTMYEKGNLRKMLASWRGGDFSSEDEACDFDIEKIIGKPCMITLSDTTKNGKTYQNISAVVRLPKGMVPMHAELPKDHVFKWIETKKANAIEIEDSLDGAGCETKNPLTGETPKLEDEVPF